MSYIQNNLMNDEQVLYTGHVHGFTLLPGIVTTGLGTAMVMFPMTHPVPQAVKAFVMLMGAMFLLSGLAHLVAALVRKMTTELALTNRRVIAKTGIIMREITEMNYSRVESFTVDQSILGMLLGYGTFFIHGVGGSKAGINCIAAPMDFRRKALEILDQTSRNNK